MIYTLIALVLGFCSPIQTAANSRMRQLVSSAALSTLISFAVSTIVLIIVALIASIPLMPSPQAFHDAPWWSWFIGIIPLITITIAIHLFKEIHMHSIVRIHQPYPLGTSMVYTSIPCTLSSFFSLIHHIMEATISFFVFFY